MELAQMLDDGHESMKNNSGDLEGPQFGLSHFVVIRSEQGFNGVALLGNLLRGVSTDAFSFPQMRTDAPQQYQGLALELPLTFLQPCRIAHSPLLYFCLLHSALH